MIVLFSARSAYRSITQRLLTLPDDLAVYPTHGGGSFCSAAAGGERTTTIGRERASNPLLVGDPDEDEFVAPLLGGLGSYPPYFLELRDVNRSGPPVHGAAPPPLAQPTVAEVDAAVTDDAELVDVRGIGRFAAGHIPGSLSNPWLAQFATWLGWLVPRDRPIVFAAGHVAGAFHVELGSLTEVAGAVPDGPVLVHCGHGERAMSAASLLERAGHRDVAVFVGGPGHLGDLEVEG